MALIRTKLLPATQTKGTRIKAYYQGRSITIGYSYTGNPELESNHKGAMIALLDKLGFDWIHMYTQTERLNDLEYVHIWEKPKESNSLDIGGNFPEVLKPQA